MDDAAEHDGRHARDHGEHPENGVQPVHAVPQVGIPLVNRLLGEYVEEPRPAADPSLEGCGTDEANFVVPGTFRGLQQVRDAAEDQIVAPAENREKFPFEQLLVFRRRVHLLLVPVEVVFVRVEGAHPEQRLVRRGEFPFNFRANFLKRVHGVGHEKFPSCFAAGPPSWHAARFVCVNDDL